MYTIAMVWKETLPTTGEWTVETAYLHTENCFFTGFTFDRDQAVKLTLKKARQAARRLIDDNEFNEGSYDIELSYIRLIRA